MALDYTTLNLLRQNHPAWRLLCAQHAPLVAGFLHRVFIVPNVRILSQADLVEALEDELFSRADMRRHISTTLRIEANHAIASRLRSGGVAA